jgi:hypothetical protein
LETGTIDVRIDGADTRWSDVALSPDDNTLYIATDGGITIYEVLATPIE